MKSLWLIYHDVHAEGPDPDLPRSATAYHLGRDAFARQLDILAAAGLESRTASSALAERKGRTLVVTFDDGWQGAFRHATPLLRDRGLLATFYVTRDFVCRPHFGTQDDLRMAAAAGMEIGVHGTTHRILSALPYEACVAEFRDCRTFLEEVIQAPVQAASMPGGAWSPRIAAAARTAGLTSLSTSRVGINRASTSAFALRRVPVRASTSLRDVRRYAKLGVGSGALRWAALELPRRALGMRNYARLRRWLLRDRARLFDA